MMLLRKIKQEIENRSDAARAAIEAARAAAAEYGLRRVVDNGEPRCLFETRGDECLVTIVNVAHCADAFRHAGFQESRSFDGPEFVFVFTPERMAEVAAIVGRA